MTTFANAIVDCVHTGLNIAKDEEGQGAYSALEVARKLLLFVSDSMPDAFDKCKMEDILSWTADEGGHVDALKSLRGHEVRKTFGLQPVMISCWTSYLGCCHGVALKALQQASDQRLIEILGDLQKQGNVAPGPHTVARIIIGRSALKNQGSAE